MDAFIAYWFIGVFTPVLTVRMLRTVFHWLKVVRP